MEINYCYKCMELMAAGEVICPHCGHDNSVLSNGRECLPEGSILNGKYLVGQVLGRGGFGITYLAVELNLKVKVAIKEYYPADVCNRSVSSRKVEVSNRQVGTEGFQKGISAFQKEAEALALYDSPSIAHVREFFRENSTAYIVMDYIEGKDLSKELRENGGKLPWQRVKDLTLPLMKALNNLHEKGLIHRDIKPDNLKIIRDEKNGNERLVLLDFGAARNVISPDQTNTYTQILTPGYAPFEQYQEQTHLGPYSDIYALCATMYTAISGETPPAAPDRMLGTDPLEHFSSFGLNIPENLEMAIFHGMETDYKNRPKTMLALYREITEKPIKTNAEPEPDSKTDESHFRKNKGSKISPEKGKRDSRKENNKKKSPLLWLIPCLLLAAVPIYLLFGRTQNSEENTADPQLVITGTFFTDQKGTETKEITVHTTVTTKPDLTDSPSSDETLSETIFIAPTDEHAISDSQEIKDNLEEIIAGTLPEIPIQLTNTQLQIYTPIPTNTLQPTETAVPTKTPIPTVTVTPSQTPQPTAVPLQLSVGESYSFGSYEQDEENGADPIEWQVLAVEDGRALLISKYILEIKSYQDDYSPVTWENSNMRNWLNGEFFDEAFAAAEQSLILEVTNSNPDNPDWGTEGGNDTRDKIFLLSVEEQGKYFENDEKRTCQITYHAAKNGGSTYFFDIINSGESYGWWLRSPGYGWEAIAMTTDSNNVICDSASVVYDTGNILNLGYYIDDIRSLVRPALWLKLPAKTIGATETGDQSGLSKTEIPAQPFVESLKLNAGDVFTFGSYRQNGNSSVETVEWQVLTVENGRALLISKYGLDTKQYHNEAGNVTWEESSLRSWLNGTFYDSTFSPTEKAGIIPVTNRNDSNPKYGTGGGRDTQDRIFLLSIEEANRYFASDSARQVKGTTYAKNNGADVNPDNDNSRWWLRSPGRSENYAAYVTNSGTVRLDGMNVFNSTDVLRPAFWLRL